MRSFNMGRFGNDDPWFRVGNLDVNTTVFIIGAGLISMFVWAAEGPARHVSKFFWLTSKGFGKFVAGGSVFDGQIWRLVTWPIPNEPDFWTVVLFAVFFMLGSQLEGSMGRRSFTVFLLILTVVPAIIVSLFEAITDAEGAVAGLRPLELGVLVAFGVKYPTARFWPGVPAWVIAALFVTLDILREFGNRNMVMVVMVLAIVGLAPVLLRSMGHAEEATWCPKVPLPAVITGESRPQGRQASTSRRKKRGRGHLSVAPPAPVAAPRKELTKLETAEMDSILDQVSEHGMDSLTPQQRQRLEDHSKRLRRRDS